MRTTYHVSITVDGDQGQAATEAEARAACEEVGWTLVGPVDQEHGLWEVTLSDDDAAEREMIGYIEAIALNDSVTLVVG